MMTIENWYASNSESRLKGRYINSELIVPIIEGYKGTFDVSIIGTSHEKRNIHLIRIGTGGKKILAWSQMHGNETTTTKALFDFLKFVANGSYMSKEISHFLESHSFYIIPILNPDGAQVFTRTNANGEDLNREARALSQPESKILRQAFDAINPELCFNMHDQRSIYGFETGKAAAVSFLSPAADAERSITPARKEAMQGIVRMNNFLQTIIPGNVGRYDDKFNPDCVGDTFQMAGVPTILFEAGHMGRDYQREKSREHIFYALLAFFGFIGNDTETEYEDYFKIPENQQNFRDLIIRNASVKDHEGLKDVAFQYKEILDNGRIIFEPILDSIGIFHQLFGHDEQNAKEAEILTNDEENLTINVKVPRILYF